MAALWLVALPASAGEWSCRCRINDCFVVDSTHRRAALTGQTFSDLDRIGRKFHRVEQGRNLFSLDGSGWRCGRGDPDARRRVGGSPSASIAPSPRRSPKLKEFERIAGHHLCCDVLERYVDGGRAREPEFCADACLSRGDCRSFSHGVSARRAGGRVTAECILYGRRSHDSKSLVSHPDYVHHERLPFMAPGTDEDPALFKEVQQVFRRHKRADCDGVREVFLGLTAYWDESGLVPIRYRENVFDPRDPSSPAIADLARDRHLRLKKLRPECFQ